MPSPLALLTPTNTTKLLYSTFHMVSCYPSPSCLTAYSTFQQLDFRRQLMTKGETSPSLRNSQHFNGDRSNRKEPSRGMQRHSSVRSCNSHRLGWGQGCGRRCLLFERAGGALNKAVPKNTHPGMDRAKLRDGSCLGFFKFSWPLGHLQKETLLGKNVFRGLSLQQAEGKILTIPFF